MKYSSFVSGVSTDARGVARHYRFKCAHTPTSAWGRRSTRPSRTCAKVTFPGASLFTSTSDSARPVGGRTRIHTTSRHERPFIIHYCCRLKRERETLAWIVLDSATPTSCCNSTFIFIFIFHIDEN